MSRPIDDRDVELRGPQLKGLQIDFIVTGGIASVESAKVIRELRRYGADVRGVMTKAATEFIAPRVIEWATKKPVLTDLTGAAEHLTMADAVVVAPATLDFIQRIAMGLADSLPASLVQSMLGRRPLVLVPSMHESLWENPLLQESLERLRKVKNVFVIAPSSEEGKQKQASPEFLVAEISHRIAPSPLRGRRVVITAGPTRSYVDDVRFLSNFSSGALGVQMAEDFYRLGAEVCLIHGPIGSLGLGRFDRVSIETASEMKAELKKRSADVFVFAAAVLDFEVRKARLGKTSSREKISVELVPSKKIIDELKGKKGLIVGFKLESRVSERELQSRVLAWAKTKPCDIIISNRLEDVTANSHRAFLWSSKDPQRFIEATTKREISAALISIVMERFSSRKKNPQS